MSLCECLRTEEIPMQTPSPDQIIDTYYWSVVSQPLQFLKIEQIIPFPDRLLGGSK